MNAQFSPLKKFAILISLCGIFGTSSLTAQSILIDSIFTKDGEIFPFNPLDTAYGLSISGRVVLNSDTSLVRVILTSDSVEQLMVYEAYPYIVSDWDNFIVRQCDETMYLDTLMPNSIRIQLVDATFVLDTIHIKEEMPANPKTLQEQHKALVENAKVNAIQNIIQLNDMLWFAERNPISDLSFSDKTSLFGDKYNMCGMDYYVGGVYDPIPGVDSPPDDSPLVENFDWRSRHGANDPEKTDYYYQSGRTGEGWMTNVKDQRIIKDCQGLCYIYGPLAAIEGVANLYFNSDQFKDYDLSEQQVLNCNLAGTHCYGGLTSWTNDYISYSSLNAGPGVVNEECYPRDLAEDECLLAHHIYTNPPEYQVRINNYDYLSSSVNDDVKECLITKGPMVADINNYGGDTHYLSLVGYGKLKINDTIHDPNHPGEYYIIDENSIYLGQTYWIFKNSWGTEDYGDDGYMYHADNQFHPNGLIYYLTPVDDVLTEDDIVLVRDEDRDGYWNWGIGTRPSGYEWPEGEDSDDSENRIGPYDGNYYGTPVRPEMLVYKPSVPDQNVVQNGGCLLFQGTNPMTIIIVVGNPGNAQLNLEQDGISQDAIVEEISDENDAYTITRKPSKIIAMGDTSHLKIALKAGALPGSVGVFKIHLNDCDKDVLSDFEFALVYEECGYLGTQLPINEYTHWDNYRTCHQDIMINRNGILEITGHVAMAENSSIFVEQGGKLIINGGTITGSCQKLWKGVDVWGDPNQPQLPYNQGMVSITNGGMIEYAEMAIETAKHFPRHDLIPSGGIVTCQDAKFKDNLVDVYLQPYQGIYSGIPQPNLSRFTRTRFETTDELYSKDYLNYDPHLAPDKHMMLKQVNGIHIEGCAFVNSSDTIDIRGIGIQSIGAGYYIEKTCKVYINPCPAYELPLFESLEYGIRAFNNTGVYTVSVDTAAFLHNHRGIFMSLVEHPTVIRSNFDLSDPGHFWVTDPNIVGLYMENFTTGFQVEENKFFGELGQTTVGIHVLNTGPVFNEIYNNTFNYLNCGITAAGENRDELGNGLCIKCNDFAECEYDINITSEGGFVEEKIGIAYLQGDIAPEPDPGEECDNTLSAGNTFSIFTGSRINYINEVDCNPIRYTYHGQNPTGLKITPSPTYPPQPTLHIELVPDIFVQYSKNNSCPSNLNGSGIIVSMEKNIVLAEISIISDLSDSLNTLLDGGSTESLNYTVQTSLPEESLILRQELLERSPYLSDTVLNSAIYKEDVLPNAIIRDILVANPQAAKSNKVLNKLYSRQDTMPEYMMDEIMQGLGVIGDLELLEQHIAGHKSIRDNSLSGIIRNYKSDTTYQLDYSDSIVLLLQQQNYLAYYTSSVFYYLERNDSTALYSTLNSVPQLFNLSDLEISENGYLLELMDILYHSQCDSTNLDSTEIQILFDISDLSKSIPGIFSRNRLIQEGMIDYQEPVFLPTILKSSIISEDQKLNSQIINKLHVFPNPARIYFILEYELGKELTEYQYIQLIDISGRVVQLIPLRKDHDQILIPTLNLTAGIYFIQLFDKEQLQAVEKIIVWR